MHDAGETCEDHRDAKDRSLQQVLEIALLDRGGVVREQAAKDLYQGTLQLQSMRIRISPKIREYFPFIGSIYTIFSKLC